MQEMLGPQGAPTALHDIDASAMQTLAAAAMQQAAVLGLAGRDHTRAYVGPGQWPAALRCAALYHPAPRSTSACCGPSRAGSVRPFPTTLLPAAPPFVQVSRLQAAVLMAVLLLKRCANHMEELAEGVQLLSSAGEERRCRLSSRAGWGWQVPLGVVRRAACCAACRGCAFMRVGLACITPSLMPAHPPPLSPVKPPCRADGSPATSITSLVPAIDRSRDRRPEAPHAEVPLQQPCAASLLEAAGAVVQQLQDKQVRAAWLLPLLRCCCVPAARLHVPSAPLCILPCLCAAIPPPPVPLLPLLDHANIHPSCRPGGPSPSLNRRCWTTLKLRCRSRTRAPSSRPSSRVGLVGGWGPGPGPLLLGRQASAYSAWAGAVTAGGHTPRGKVHTRELGAVCLTSPPSAPPLQRRLELRAS